jgi:hypothetical protein
MSENILIYQEVFKRDPELQENVFIVQRLYETESFLKKTLQGIPKDEQVEKCFKSMIEICKNELKTQFEIIGTEILKMMYDEMYERKSADDVCTNPIKEK